MAAADTLAKLAIVQLAGWCAGGPFSGWQLVGREGAGLITVPQSHEVGRWGPAAPAGAPDQQLTLLHVLGNSVGNLLLCHVAVLNVCWPL